MENEKKICCVCGSRVFRRAYNINGKTYCHECMENTFGFDVCEKRKNVYARCRDCGYEVTAELYEYSQNAASS